MKKPLLLSAIASILISVGCKKYDDTGLQNRVGSLENRVAKLEELCKQLNSDISSLQTIVTALQNNDYVTGVIPVIKNGETVGYTITFSNSLPITIYHGENGKDGADGRDGYTPQIGVRQYSDGIYYWTLDGEWLTDGSGNKIKAEGGDSTNGKDGITPRLKIEDGWWYISYNDGASWTKLDKATGEDGDSFFKNVDTASSDEYVIFTLADGTEIKLPRLSLLTLTLDKEGVIEIEPNSSVSIGYTITGNTDDVSIEVMATGDIKAKVSKTTSTAGTIIITSGDIIDEEYSRVVVIVTNGEKTVMKSLEFVEAFPDNMERMFPDPIFRKYVLNNFDTNKNGKISKEEAEDVLFISYHNNSPNDESQCIKSLEGIQYFTNLRSLNCSYHRLTSLNVSKNTKLENLYCDYNQLTALDVSKNTQLTHLHCEQNQLTSLDVSNNTQLIQLYCHYNQLSTLDVIKNTQLDELLCSQNQLTTLNVSGCTQLRYLVCEGNQLTALDVSNNTQLRSLKCEGNQLTALDVSNNTQLRSLKCGGNQLTTLDVSGCTQLTELRCYFNQLTTLDVSGCMQLEKLYCYSNQLTTLNASGFTQLTELHCYSNQLTTLNVSGCTQLTHLYCYSNQLTTLNVSECTALGHLDCYSNQLTTLDVSKTSIGAIVFDGYPLDCAPMETLQTLYLKEGWRIKGITYSRYSTIIPEHTEIKFIN